MDSEDVTQVQIRPPQFEPIDAFNHALSQFGLQLAHLSSGVLDGDAELVGRSANYAVGAWLAADAACRQLARDLGEPVPLAEAMKFGLTERFDALQSLLDQAHGKFADTALQQQLHHLRGSLESARN